MKAEGKDKIEVMDGVRLPNVLKGGPKMTINTDNKGATQSMQMIQSPTSFLNGAPGSPRLETFCASDNSNSMQIEGEMVRKAT